MRSRISLMERLLRMKVNRKPLTLAFTFALAAWTAACTAPTCFATPTSFVPEDSDHAREYLTEAVKQMGGEAALRALKTVRLEGMGHREMVEQSERPEGPYIVEYDHGIVEWRDLEHQRWKQTMVVAAGPFPDTIFDTVVAEESAKMAFDHNFAPGSPDNVQNAHETLELGPERVLLTALAASDLHAEADTVLQSVPHHVVAFTWRGLPVRLYLNRYTALPTEVEWQSAYPSQIFWSAWGDVTTQLYYSLWWLCPGGIHYPLQWDFVRNGLPDHVLTITKISTNVEIPADTFAISADEKAAFEKRRHARRPSTRHARSASHRDRQRYRAHSRRVECNPGAAGGWDCGGRGAAFVRIFGEGLGRGRTTLAGSSGEGGHLYFGLMASSGWSARVCGTRHSGICARPECGDSQASAGGSANPVSRRAGQEPQAT